jgi:Flp pilus assembly protein TadG
MLKLLRTLRIEAFARSQSAVSALEFALVLPIMLTLYFGGLEVGEALTINRKVTHVTSALADLVTQSKVITNTDMTNILKAAAAGALPYGHSLLRIKISQVSTTAAGLTTVDWSDALHDTALAKGAPYTLPPAVKENGTSIVVAEVHYTFTPTIGYVMAGSYDLTDKFYLRPRLVPKICRPTCGP